MSVDLSKFAAILDAETASTFRDKAVALPEINGFVVGATVHLVEGILADWGNIVSKIVAIREHLGPWSDDELREAGLGAFVVAEERKAPIGEAYRSSQDRAKDAFAAKIAQTGPVEYTEAQYKAGLDAFGAPVSEWTEEIFGAELAAGYELSYGQMCNAFFDANDEARGVR